MTLWLSSAPADMEVFHGHVGIARCRQVPIILVNVLCAAADNVTRRQSAERIKGQKIKLTDLTVLQEIRVKARLLHPAHDTLDVQV